MSTQSLMATFLLLALSCVAAEQQDTAATTCEAEIPRDHALLQMGSGNEALVKTQRRESSSCGSVQRRRRHSTMAACRRRHSSMGHADTDRPGDRWKCNEDSHSMWCDEAASISDGRVGFPSSGRRKAANLWCAVDVPPAQWNLKSCPSSASTQVKVLTYNLYWWNLFDRHGGSDRSAGRQISSTAGTAQYPEQYDFMGFQECEDVRRVLGDAGMGNDYETIDGGYAIAMAYRKSRWSLLDHASVEVGEDSRDQYYGKRIAMWARLQNGDGKTIFFMNHHGPLKVSQSGGCTGSATALNIMRVIGENAHSEDAIILVGDFNAQRGSSRIQELERRLTRVFSGDCMGGVDHVFTNCGDGARGEILGKGKGNHKSDHDAVSVTLRV